MTGLGERPDSDGEQCGEDCEKAFHCGGSVIVLEYGDAPAALTLRTR